ncbi:MAG TPA: BTAD domain-containing putative transcriptional regulator [Thermoleophilaceae bacterium]|jgi:DNA-binding SARP family transcriptional activator
MDFRILGPVEVLENGRAVPLGGRKQRAVLALLVLNANRVVSSERLIDVLWGERPPPTAATALQGHVSRLRKALGPGAIVTRTPGYALDPDSAEIDLRTFERLRGEARAAADAGEPAVAADRLREALALWRGDALADIASEPAVQGEAAALEDLRLAAIEERIEADLALGRGGELVAELERLVAADPLRERLWGQLMLSLYRAGRQADALDAYQRARRTLVAELGIEPGPALRELERRILEQDPALDRGEAEPAGRPPAAPAVEINLLGPPRVHRDGRPVSFDTRKALALLAHLALADRPRSREALCELLWPGQDTEHARGALRRTLSALRKAIGDGPIDTAGDSVALRDGVAVDARRFRALASPGADLEELERAVDLFRGDLLEGFSVRDSPEFDAWYAYEADALQRELSGALGRLVRLLVEREENEAAIGHARRWLALDPLHEPAHRELIRLYALTGDRAAALGQYRECVRTLTQELGVPPTEETAALFESISEGAPLAAPPEAAAAPAAAPAARPGELPLVGRAAELAALVETHRAASPDGRLAVIEGEAGIGKTRLARELATAVEARGGTVLAARCHDDEVALPYGPVLELLREALRRSAATIADEVLPERLADASLLLPELATLRQDLPATTGLTGPAAQARLLEAVASVLAAAATGPGVVFIDDLHGADEATLDAIAYLGRRLRGRPLVLLLAWRTEGVPPGHRLRRLATEMNRAGTATLVRLARLDEPQVSELVREVAPGLERRVFVESEGLPLFVAEYLAAIAAGGEPEEGALPREMRDLLETRLTGLGPIARQLLEAAAVAGRSFDLDGLRAASGRSDEETADGMEELVRRGLVRELVSGYDFTHEKLRELVYQDVGLARRRLLHRRVAEALLRAAPGAESASLLAQHLRLAGDDGAAAEQHRRAADHAAFVLAHKDAIEHLESALALGYPDGAELRELMGDLRTLVGDYAGALASYEIAAAGSEGAALAGLEHKLGGVHQRRGEWARAEARFAVALEALGSEVDPGLRARILADLSLTLQHAGEAERALTTAAEARALAESAADEHAQAQAHNLLGVLARAEGRTADARAELERSLALAEDLSDPAARAAALNNLALLARDEADLDRALELTEEALALCAEGGDRHREAALENNLADLHHAAGRPDESMSHLKRAVTIFSEIGADESTRLPEVWKLVSW